MPPLAVRGRVFGYRVIFLNLSSCYVRPAFRYARTSSLRSHHACARKCQENETAVTKDE
jgi:hypothetical protein